MKDGQNPLNENNEFKIVEPNGFLKWFKEAFLLIIDRPFFWLMYSTFFAAIFSLSSNVIYLHTAAAIATVATINLARYFYSGKITDLSVFSLKKHAFLIFNWVFICILLRYFFYLASMASLLFNSYGLDVDKAALLQFSISDYLNPIDMINSGVWRDNFDLFLFNALVMPFHYIQISIFGLFFSLSVFFYPLFIWKNNSASFSYRLSLKVSLANAIPVSITMIIFVFLTFVVYSFPLSAFPYCYILSGIVLYCMWADIFDEKKKAPVLAKRASIEMLPVPMMNGIKKEKETT